MEYTTKYIVDPSGKVQIDTDLKPFGNIISFPRIGYTMTVKSGNDTFHGMATDRMIHITTDIQELVWADSPEL